VKIVPAGIITTNERKLMKKPDMKPPRAPKNRSTKKSHEISTTILKRKFQGLAGVVAEGLFHASLRSRIRNRFPASLDAEAIARDHGGVVA
jgi:hypothetical protein